MTPDPNQNEPSKMKRITSASMDDSIHAKLPQVHHGEVEDGPVFVEPPPPVPVQATPEPEPRGRSYNFLPAFWTIASVLSMIVNIVLIVILLLVFQMWSRVPEIQGLATDQASGLLGGLYTNFVKMDRATIATTIPVDANIPLNIVVPVQTQTEIRLAERAVIRNAHVFIDTGEVRINANATVTLPVDTPLTVTINFPLNVRDQVPIHLEVPVRIPLNQTELHEPFVGLQKVVEPWYCLVEPNATVNGLQVCSQTAAPSTDPAVTDPTINDPTLIDPTFRTPVPGETVTP